MKHRLFGDSLKKRLDEGQKLTLAAKRAVPRPAQVSDIASDLGLIEAGEFRVGNQASPGSGFTGTRLGYPEMSYGGETYSLATIRNDVLQVGINTSGVLTWGAGKGQLTSSGMEIVQGNLSANRIRWVDSSDEVVGFVQSFLRTGVPEMTLEANEGGTGMSPTSYQTGLAGIVAYGAYGTEANFSVKASDPTGSANDTYADLALNGKAFLNADYSVGAASSGRIVFNEGGENISFRIESNNKTHMFFLSSADKIGINTSTPPSTLSINGIVNTTKSTITVNSTGEITPTTSFVEVNGAGAAADNLDTINGNEGDLIILTRGDADITIRDGQDNIQLDGGVDFVLDTVRKKIMLIGTEASGGAIRFDEISRSSN